MEQPLHHMCPSPGIAMPPTGEEVLNEAQAAVAEKCAGAQFAPLDRYMRVRFVISRGISISFRNIS